MLLKAKTKEVTITPMEMGTWAALVGECKGKGRLTHKCQLRVEVVVAVVELDVVHTVNAGEEGEWKLE